MDDNVIGGNTYGGGITVVVEEIRTSTTAADRVGAHFVKFSCRDTRACCFTQAAVNFYDDKSRLTHPLHLVASFVFNARHAVSFR